MLGLLSDGVFRMDSVMALPASDWFRAALPCEVRSVEVLVTPRNNLTQTVRWCSWVANRLGQSR